MSQPKDYDWETQRINAFLIINNKLYESRTHSECLCKALNLDMAKYGEMDDIDQIYEDLEIEGKEIEYDYILGEVADIDGIKSIICVGDMKADRDTISKYYKDISYEYYYD